MARPVPGDVRLLLPLLSVLVLSAPGSTSAELAIGSRSAEGGWIVTVSAERVGLGPVDVSVGPLRPATGSGRQWLRHDLVLTNTGDRRVTFADTWRGDVLARRGLPMLVAQTDWRCRYRAVRPIRAVCVLPLDFISIRPGRSVIRTVTVWKGIRRMAPLEPGTYVFRQPLRFRFGKHPPAEGEGRTGAVELVYNVAADAGT